MKRPRPQIVRAQLDKHTFALIPYRTLTVTELNTKTDHQWGQSLRVIYIYQWVCPN